MTVRCGVAALARGDELAGTASVVGAYLLVEAPGPWGVSAPRDSRLPDEVKAWLHDEATRTGVKVLLIRRVGRSEAGPTRVFAIRPDAVAGWAESATVEAPGELTAIDLAALGSGRSPGLEPWPGPLVLVCTHGQHDRCCAERGRPLARAMADAIGDGQVWESSHLGGHRFAGNVLALPEGLAFGRAEPEQAAGLLATLRRGELDLDLLRGRTTLTKPAQYAEVALRRALGKVRIAEVRPRGTRSLDEATIVASFDAGHLSYDVTVRTTSDVVGRLSCPAMAQEPVPRHEVTAITPPPRGPYS